MSNINFILRTAWRDSRRSRSRLFLFISAIVAGIAALTAVRSFSDNLRTDIDREAKTLLGADLSISGNHPAADSLLAPYKIDGVEKAKITNFVSMVRFPKNGGTRLADVRALEGNYPFFGKWKSEPKDAYLSFREGKTALVDHSLMLQFDIKPGDSIQIGEVVFKVEGDLLSSAGRAGFASSIAPVVFIPAKYLEETKLVQMGSRVDYQYYFKMPKSVDPDALIEGEKDKLREAKLEWDTVSSRKKRVGRAFGDFTAFLNLVGFIALLLGCIGIAGAVHVYIREKLQTVAILRCLGASGRQAFAIYLVQVAAMGLIGGLLGATLGSLLQMALPAVMKDFLPIENISTAISPITFLQGVLMGVVSAVLFALLPLGSILKTSPLRAMRASVTEENVGLRWQVGVYTAILIALVGAALWLMGSWKQTLYFVGGLAVAVLILYLTSRFAIYLVRRFFPRKGSFTLRQAIANLYRPNNQTTLLTVTIGLGAMLLSTLFLTQSLILGQVAFSGTGSQPNMILFDIQTNQKDSIRALVERKGLPVLQDVPIVTMRLESMNGLTKADFKKDTSSLVGASDEKIEKRKKEDEARPRRWVWDREYRVSFRDTLIDTEEIIKGEWIGTYDGNGPVPVSLSERLAESSRAEIGDILIYNVQGVPLECRVASIREVDFTRVQTNFFLLFPTNVLEKAPQFHVLVSRVKSPEQSANFQSELIEKYPNVSAIDLTQILKSLEEVLTKITFVIRFMAFFSILTGLLVLISSVYQSKFARAKESVLLRTLGASRKQILSINGVEYLLLGGLAAFVGVGLSIFSAFGLSQFVFKMPFTPSWTPLIFIFLAISGLVFLLGLLFSRGSLNRPPLEVLRSDV